MSSAISRATSPALSGRARSAWRYSLLAFIFVVAAAYQAGLTVDILRGLKVSVPYFALQDASPQIEGVKSEAEAAGVRRGDTLIAVNGRPYTGTAVLAQEEAKAAPGTELAVTVRESGKEQTRTLHLPVTRPPGKLGESAVPIVLLIFIPAICLVLGCWVVLVRPRDRLAWLLLGLLLSFTQLFGERSIEGWPPIIREAAMAYHVGLASSWPIFMFVFGFYFPEPFPHGHRVQRWTKPIWWLVIVPLAVAGVIDVVILAGQIASYAAVQPIYRATLPFETVAEALTYVAVSGFFCFIFIKSAGYSPLPPDARRRFRLLYWGTTAALTPGLALAITSAIKRTPFELLPQWATYPALLMLVLFPLTLAYVIVVQRAMDVRVVLRQGLQYGLAKGGIRVLQVIAIIVVVWTALRMLRQGSGNPEMIVVIALGLFAIFSIGRAAGKLLTWTDRRFFREAYDAERVLSELSDHVRSIVETRPLIETVADRISETLHIPHIAVLLGGSGPYRPAYALGYGTPPDVIFPSGGGTVKVLTKQKEPARVLPRRPGVLVVP
jgi:sigma-B regulation protein RsbU (phosphoserine phosphatase)